MDMCITIRTIMLNGTRMFLQAGGGHRQGFRIPGENMEETINKSRAMLKPSRKRILF